MARAANALRLVLARHPDDTIVLVGHDSVNRALLLELLDQPLSAYWRIAQSPCCLNEIDVTDGKISRAAHQRDAAPGGLGAMTFVGRSVPRLEDRPLVTGNGRFAADISFAHQLHMRVVRSAHAHGAHPRDRHGRGTQAPGVVAVWTAADVADIPPIDFRLTRIEGLDPYRQPILATDRVRYVGEPVAVVFATDPYIAEDAADLVTVEIEALPELIDADAPPGDIRRPAIRPKSPSSARAMATWTRPLLARTLSSRSI